MPAHIKSALTNSQLTLSLKNKKLNSWNLARSLFV